MVEPVETTLLAICADVRDPGNAGTVVRCADAAGADAVVFAGHSVDPYNPKTVRASVGSLFHLPIAVEPDPAAAVRAAQAAGLVVLAADGAGEVDLDEADDLLARPTAWLFGNEAWGLPDELAALADHRVRIPIHGRAESLNLSTAAALCLYASARAQRAARPGPHVAAASGRVPRRGDGHGYYDQRPSAGCTARAACSVHAAPRGPLITGAVMSRTSLRSLVSDHLRRHLRRPSSGSRGRRRPRTSRRPRPSSSTASATSVTRRSPT